jgi:phthiodiolone/phenolphthiodiolone dimycocerosates ketoreductase
MLGVFGHEVWKPGGIQTAIRGAQLLEKLGYQGLGLSDQHQSWFFRSLWRPDLVPAAADVPDHEAFYDTLVLTAALATHTERIRFAPIVDCFRRTPAHLAQSLLTLDQISGGRVSVSVGNGEDKQFVPYGIERTEPKNAHLEEAIRIIRALLRSSDPLSMPGNRFWKLNDALIALEPVEPKRPPAVIMVGGGNRAMRIAARVADRIGTYLPGAYAGRVEGFQEDLASFWNEVDKIDRDPAELVVAASGAEILVLCENDEQIERAYMSPYTRATALNLTPLGKHWRMWGSTHPLGDDWALSMSHRSTMFRTEELLDIVSKVQPEDLDHTMFIGRPEDCAERVVPWLRAAGVREIPLTTGYNFATILFPEQLELADNGLPAGTISLSGTATPSIVDPPSRPPASDWRYRAPRLVRRAPNARNRYPPRSAATDSRASVVDIPCRNRRGRRAMRSSNNTSAGVPTDSNCSMSTVPWASGIKS